MVGKEGDIEVVEEEKRRWRGTRRGQKEKEIRKRVAAGKEKRAKRGRR